VKTAGKFMTSIDVKATWGCRFLRLLFLILKNSKNGTIPGWMRAGEPASATWNNHQLACRLLPTSA
jgi:hypothetical protein